MMNYKKIFSLSIFLSLFISEFSFATPIEWSVLDGGNGNLYEAILKPDGISWKDAKTEAESLGGHLATITSVEENSFVSNLFSGDPNFWLTVGADTRGPWIGGFQTAGSVEPDQGFSWVTNETFNFTNWALSANGIQQPNNRPIGEDSIHFFGAGVNNFTADTWNDLLADSPGVNPVAFILEIEAPNNPDPQPVHEPSTIIAIGMVLVSRIFVRRN
jgi:hypothetical protein